MTKPIDSRKAALLQRIEALETPEAIAQLHRELDILELKEQHPDLPIGVRPQVNVEALAREQGYTGTDCNKINKLIARLDFGEDVDQYFNR